MGEQFGTWSEAFTAVLGTGGIVVSVNDSWREFARNGAPSFICIREGSNFISECEAAALRAIPGARGFATALRRILGGDPKQFTQEFECQSGTDLRWLRGRIIATAKPPGAIVLLEDITGGKIGHESLPSDNLRKAESEHRRDDSRFDSLIESLHAGVVLQGPKCEIFLCNPAAQNLLGMTRSQLLGKTSLDPEWRCVHEDGTEFPGAEHPVPRAIANKQPVRNVVMGVYRKQPPNPVWLLVNADPRIGSNGAVKYVICTFIDITEQKLVQDELRQSQMQLQTLMDASPVAISWYNAQNRIEYCNRKFTTLFGYTLEDIPTLEEWRKRAFPDPVYREKVVAGWIAKIERAKQTCAEPEEHEYTVTCKDGSSREIAAVGSLVNGRLLVMFNDVTQQKIDQERLRKSEKMHALGLLAGGIAHDFNNQLTPILGYAEILRNRLQDEKLRRYTEPIIRASMRSADLIAQLLAFAQKGKYQAVTVDVHAIIMEVISLLNRGEMRQGDSSDTVPVEIIHSLNANPCLTTGDPNQILNAFLNLALNAKDAMPKGGKILFDSDVVSVSSSTRSSTPQDLADGRYLRVSVSDTGVGMTADTIKRLFEPFFTTKKPGEGTGMGLAAVYGIVKNHKGTIAVRSTVGSGSTFEVFLPLTEMVSSPVVHVPVKEAEEGSGGHILVVDDEEGVSELVADILGGLGYVVTICSDGISALRHYREAWKSIDLVVLDLMMPNLSGRETFAGMRQINPAVKVIVSSGFSRDGQAQLLLDQGALDFIQKPYHVGELSDKVNAALRKR